MKILLIFFLLSVSAFVFKTENTNHSYFVPIDYYNSLIKGDSNKLDMRNLVCYIHKFHFEKEFYLSSCKDELYGAIVSFYKNCKKYKDSTVYYFGDIYLSNKNRTNPFFPKKINYIW